MLTADPLGGGEPLPELCLGGAQVVPLVADQAKTDSRHGQLAVGHVTCAAQHVAVERRRLVQFTVETIGEGEARYGGRPSC